MNSEKKESVVNLLCDRERIDNIIANNIVGRFITSHITYFKVTFFEWVMLEDGIKYDSSPSIIYILKNENLTDAQSAALADASTRNRSVKS